MKTNAIIRIVLFSLAILILSSILLGIVAFKTYRFDVNRNGITLNPVEDVTEQFSFVNFTPDIRNIEIDWVAGSIIIQKDPSATEITVHEIFPIACKYTMFCKQSGQTLKIQYSDDDVFQFPSFGINYDISKDLTITVPVDWECDKLEIDTAAAEVVVNDLTISEFDFDGASGDCHITNCDIGEIDLDTVSGNVMFSGTLDKLECDAMSADCSVEVSNIPKSVKMDGVSGDLELILPPDAGFTCYTDGMISNFSSDFELANTGGTYVHGDGACRIDVDALSGNVSILKGIE